jgi:hypothetical protein
MEVARIELLPEGSDADVTALVASGYLAQEERADGVAIKKAIETVISDIAFDLEYGLAEASPRRGRCGTRWTGRRVQALAGF